MNFDETIYHPTRNYDAYVYEMNAALDQKFEDIKPFLNQGGVIFDDGCGDGSLLRRVAHYLADNWHEVRAVGVDGSREMIRRAMNREPVVTNDGLLVSTYFVRGHIQGYSLNMPEYKANTVIASSVLHEVWSYGAQEESVQLYLQDKFDQLKPGGRLIIRDVVGPEEPDNLVRMRCNTENGNDRQQNPALLSTHGLFELFLKTFKRDGYAVKARPSHPCGKWDLRLQDAAEFILKLPYTDQWFAEMREEFCFWSFSRWCRELADAGFKIVGGSKYYTNEWRITNHFEDRVQLFDLSGDPLPYPPTNMVLVGEKR